MILNRGIVLHSSSLLHAYSFLPSNQSPFKKIRVTGKWGYTLPYFQSNMSAYCIAEWRNVLIGGANWEIKEEALWDNNSRDRESFPAIFMHNHPVLFSSFPASGEFNTDPFPAAGSGWATFCKKKNLSWSLCKYCCLSLFLQCLLIACNNSPVVGFVPPSQECRITSSNWFSANTSKKGLWWKMQQCSILICEINYRTQWSSYE